MVLVLLDALYKTEVFKRGHLVALSGINENTLKVYLPLLNKASGRMTEERKASRFTGVEAMAVMLMAELQRDWDTKPEHSFLVAWRVCFAFCEQRAEGLLRPRLGFPFETWSIASAQGDVLLTRCGVAPRAVADELAGMFERGPRSLLVLPDRDLNDRYFKPVLALRQTITGIDLLGAAERDARARGVYWDAEQSGNV
jgi:hypothetical protein